MRGWEKSMAGREDEWVGGEEGDVRRAGGAPECHCPLTLSPL